MDSEMEVIAACPKCGGTGVIMSDGNGENYFVKCHQCGNSNSDDPSVTMCDAVEKWNKLLAETRAEISVEIYNLYWYAERNAENYAKFCEALKRYCDAKE